MAVTDRGVATDLHLNGERISIADMVRFARSAEDTGFGGVWTGEIFREAFVPLAAIATATTRVWLGSNVAQWTRSLPNVELVAGDMQELSGGRFVLGLGSMPREWNENWHGIAYHRPLQRMREYIEAIRLLWTASPENPVTYKGDFFQVKDYVRFNGALAHAVPIYLGVTRAGLAQLAAEVADGISFNAILSPLYIKEVMRPIVERAAAAAGRSLREIVLAHGPVTAVSGDREEAFRRAKHQIAFYAGVTTYFEAVMRHHGFLSQFNAIKGAFSSGDPAGAISLVTDEMVEQLTLAGTPDEVREKLGRYEGVVDRVILVSPGFLLSSDEIRANHEAIVEALVRA